MTPRDLIRLALRDAGVNGMGQEPSAEDSNDAFTHLNMMLGQWNRQRWLVYHLIDVSVVSTGATSYSVGSGGDFNTPRPDKIDSAYVRFLSPTPASDWPVAIIPSKEDFDLIRVKTIGTIPSYVWYDADYPTGIAHFWPVANATIYELHLTLKATLTQFPNLSTDISLPPEYLEALLYNLGVRLRLSYQLPPDPALNALARVALNTIRSANAQVPLLRMPRSVMSGTRRANIYAGY